MSVVNAIPLLLGDEGYQISRSVRVRKSASANFSRTPASAGNRRTWTWSGWVKRGELGTIQTFFSSISSAGVSTEFDFYFATNNTLQIGYGAANWRETVAVYRDVSAWYHIVLSVDTTQASDSNRILLYVNGVSQTLSTLNAVTQNTDTAVNMTYTHRLGGVTSYFGDLYLTEINFIDGQALTPSSFGETDAITGVWKPKKYAGTYGTNGFYLNFYDNSSNTATTIGKDSSGNGNNWTPNNISVTAGSTYDSMLDVPTLWADGGNGRGNYCVASPIDKNSNISIANANLTATNSGGGSWASGRCTIAVSSGKWYWEIDETFSSGGPLIMGIADAAFNVFTQRAGDTSGSYVLAIDGNKGNNGTFSSYVGSAIASGRNIGVALDLDGGTLTFYNNGVSLGTAFSSISGTFAPVFSIYGTQGGTLNFNFGQRPFAYTPPTGFKALNTQNLPEPTIKLPNKWMDVSIWTGDGTTNRTITNSGSFQPDLVWTKGRSATWQNFLQDSVRGAANFLISDTVNAETTTSPNIVSSFASNGFVIQNNGNSNQSGNTYVAWQWKESATPGFDIVTYTGTGSAQNISHSLGVVPRMFILKKRNGTSDWLVYHAVLGNTQALKMNTTDATEVQSVWFNNTSPTSSVFTVGSANNSNASGATYVAYCFSQVAGFSAFGSYTGNGSTDGPFVFTGFRPRWVMIKRTDTAETWTVVDSSRTTINKNSVEFLQPNSSGAEFTDTNSEYDFLANGFKLKDAGNLVNASGGTYVYAAFAETPFRNSLAR